MPFNSAGVYTPTSGTTTAAPGDIIRSATWNSAFTDISSALTLLGQQLYGSTSVTSTPYAPIAADSLLLVNVAGAVSITLPASATRTGYPLAVKDVSGAANTNNITITPNGSEHIDGLTSVVISDAYMGYQLFPVTSGWILRP